MLARTPYTLILLRTAQAQADENARRQRLQAAKVKANPPRPLNRQRFRALVDRTAAILKAGYPTLFAHEGACRHGLRSSLCLQGWSWTDADFNAAAIVAAALNQVGVMRPTWQQGQLEYADETVERMHCLHCHRPVSIGENGRPRKYCSDECLNSYHSKMNSRYGFERSRAEYLAACAADRAKKAIGERDCERCGKRFRQGSYKDRTYCSDECANAVRSEATRRHDDRACLQCGTMFRPRYASAKFCGRACMSVSFSETTRRPAKACEHCGGSFHPSHMNEKFCSKACRYQAATKRPEKPCEQCGTMFKPKFNVKDGENRFCSRDCQGLARRKEMPEQTCPTCSTIFRAASASEARVYCSPACRPVPLQPRPCAHCGDEFRPRSRGNGVVGLYCSRECSITARRAQVADAPPLAPDELEPLARASAFRCDEM
ncbi:hypothetical protein [Aminobacter sp. Piv2-1]|uniref:hypothetical protein n=1 Tax=Aminobacter sp. Piv2-1 TaxID=3031122 RepID=UPI0030A47F07